MSNLSAQSRAACLRWIFENSAELTKRREAANRKFILERADGMNEDAIAKQFLTPVEERMLYKSYESILLKFCQKFQPPLPKNVIGSSFQYFRRFYLDNSVMDYHPKDIVFTCVYLAAIVEEFTVSITRFVSNVKGDREKAKKIILYHELLLMQKLNFDLAVYNPFTNAELLLTDIKTRYPQLQDPDRFRPAIEEFLEKIQFSDACFLYSSPQIALAAIACGAEKFEENIDGYLSQIVFNGHPEKVAFVQEARRNIFLMIRNESPFMNEPMIASLEKKLEKCRNQENDPSSIVYKRKLEELQDDDDDDDDDEIEPAQKYSRLLEP